ncbi:hypothetical protein NPIL_197691 [Nephila pilipes]|uniref:Uncharacterized protein n=1 Tax=Nephila pilipes TaxID=299642 RepID=A0A8X6NBB5_NEPPI|nr:hypothetical protein NPIL_197691 [Nephila pilipes]
MFIELSMIDSDILEDMVCCLVEGLSIGMLDIHQQKRILLRDITLTLTCKELYHTYNDPIAIYNNRIQTRTPPLTDLSIPFYKNNPSSYGNCPFKISCHQHIPTRINSLTFPRLQSGDGVPTAILILATFDLPSAVVFSWDNSLYSH